MTAIVTDAHYRMSVSLIRDLFDRGVRVAACEKASIEAPVGFASRGAAQCVRLPDEEYEAALLALCREVLEIEGEKPVLLPVGAKTLAMVSRSRDAFSAVAGLCAATPSQLALFNDKAAVSALAKTLGVPVPESFERQPEEADEPFFSRVPLPCAVKPHCGESFGLTASQRYRICRTKNELIAAFRHFQTLTNEDPIVQEYLPGTAFGCSVLAKDGAVYRSLCHANIRSPADLRAAAKACPARIFLPFPKRSCGKPGSRVLRCLSSNAQPTEVRVFWRSTPASGARFRSRARQRPILPTAGSALQQIFPCRRRSRRST